MDQASFDNTSPKPARPAEFPPRPTDAMVNLQWQHLQTTHELALAVAQQSTALVRLSEQVADLRETVAALVNEVDALAPTEDDAPPAPSTL